jgi:hypothetical protein
MHRTTCLCCGCCAICSVLPERSSGAALPQCGTCTVHVLGARDTRDPAAANASQMILNGGSLRVAGHQASMPAFGRGYTDAEIAALSNFVVRDFGAKEGIVNSQMITNRRSSR